MSIKELKYSEPYLLEQKLLVTDGHANDLFSLRDFVQQLLSSLFTDKHISFAILDCKKQETQKLFIDISFTHQYLIVVEADFKLHKLKKAFRKDITVLKENDNKTIVYWFDGEELCASIGLVDEQKQKSLPIITNPIINSFIDSITLPDWLDSYIFDELDAKYAPNYVRYEYNLDLSKDEIKTYLGTYFPRSYTESFCIFDNLLSNPKYNSIMQQKSEISILDFGCGTGGEIVGLLTALSKYLPNLKTVNVLAIDGNHSALRHSSIIIERFKLQSPFLIKYNVGPIAISDCSDVEIIDEIVQSSFDYILSFKAICELISKQRIEGNAYKYVAEILSPKLTDNGLILLLDVTVKNDLIGTYYPIYMNQGVRTFVNDSETFKTLIPLSCFIHENSCNQQCFTQRTFKVTHSRKSNDISKVAYRITGRKDFVESIAPKFLKGKMIIQVKNGEELNCPYSNGELKINSYDINN